MQAFTKSARFLEMMGSLRGIIVSSPAMHALSQLYTYSTKESTESAIMQIYTFLGFI